MTTTPTRTASTTASTGPAGGPVQAQRPAPAPSPTTPGFTGGPSGQADRQRSHVPHWMVLVVAALAQFMVILDVSIVNVALPSMRTSLGLSTSGLQWVVNAYALTFAGLLLLGGRAADFFGRKRVFVVGVVVFSLASLAGGFAQSEAWIVAARAVQGVGGAILAPSTLSLLTTTYTDPAERGKALGVWGAVGGAGGAMGGLVGGVLTQALDWRWVLFVNVPIGILLVVGALWALTESRGRVSSVKALDLPGSITVTLGLSAVVYAVVGAETHPWGSAATIVPLAVGVALLALFLAIEMRTAEPLVPLGIFRRRALSAANGVALAAGMGMFSFWFFMSLYLQRVHGLDALEAGLAFMPASLTLIAGSTLSTRLTRRVGPKPVLVAGPLLAAVGLVWMSGASADGSYVAQLVLPALITGFGIGLTMVPLAAAATAGVPHEQAGLASGLINTSRQVGGAIGLAVLSTIAVSRTEAVAGGSGGQAAALAAGYDRGLLGAAVLVAVGAVVALAIPAQRRGPQPRHRRERAAG